MLPRREGAKRNSAGQCGSARMKTLIWLFILIVFGYVCWKVVPVQFANYKFQDTVLTTARLAAVNRQSDDDLKKTILQAAQDDGLPVTAEDIQIIHNGYNVQISVDYSVTVDLRVYQWTFHFHPSGASAI